MWETVHRMQLAGEESVHFFVFRIHLQAAVPALVSVLSRDTARLLHPLLAQSPPE